nr:glutathione S-transferase N-terminal domain-containing protein [Pleurocapsa sp. FMAR1]
MYRVYGDIQSGNCYKIKLLMNHLEIEHQWIELDILQGETRTEKFIAKNPSGKIPVLEPTRSAFSFQALAWWGLATTRI